MAKHEAVDRLMALATEKRADRVAPGAPIVPTASERIESVPEVLAAEETPLATEAAASRTTLPDDRVRPQREHAGPSAADRGRQLLQSIRPLLPAVAGAMRMVDHGAVQAIARLLPLLGGGLGLPAPTARPQTATPSLEQEQFVRGVLGLEAEQQRARKDLDALALRAAEADDQLKRLRTQAERAVADQAATANDLRAMGERVRLLTAGTIILLMLVIAEMILLVVALHR